MITINKEASKRSLSQRRKSFGVGVNDSSHAIALELNGVRLTDTIYVIWHSMIRRCYSPVYQAKNPTYKGCTVCDEWIYFTSFEKWAKNNYSDGKHLDKDILIRGNKVYSPDTCIFVDQRVNKLLNNHARKRGKYLQGVTIRKDTRKFRAEISINGNTFYLGEYASEEEAHIVYRIEKANYIMEVAKTQKDKRVKSALIRASKEWSIE